jgi:hypothetical protein
MGVAWRSAHDTTFSQSLRGVLSAAEVSRVTLLRFSRPHAFLGREVSEEARALARVAREQYRNKGYGFWEELLSISVTATKPTRCGILDRAVAQREPPVARQELPVRKFLHNLDDGSYSDLPERDVVAICSGVQRDGNADKIHLPMIDFAIKSAPHNENIMLDIAESLNLDGSIFNSGRSYHYYGARPLSVNELPRFLARAQLLAPLVDYRWACYQIMDGECSLRISTDRERHTVPPRLVASSL